MKHLKTLELYEKLGDCYQAGGRLIMNFFGDKNHRLVHGMVSGQGSLEGMRYGHCWVESKDTVLDHSNGKKLEIPTKVYYALGRVDPAECKYYSPKEAARFMSEEEHWGPWEMSGDPVSINEDIPDDQKEIGKREIKIKNKDMKTMKSFEDFSESVNEASADWKVKDIIEMQKAHENVLAKVSALNKAVQKLEKLDKKNAGKSNAEMFVNDVQGMRRALDSSILDTDSRFWKAWEEYKKGGKAAFPSEW